MTDGPAAPGDLGRVLTDAAVAPRYGRASLAEVLPALLTSVGAGGGDRLGLPRAHRAVLLLVDGLPAAAAARLPFVGRHLAGRLDAGFPSTTVTSLATLATGRPPGRHGLVGVSLALPDLGRAFNVLRWELVGPRPKADARVVLPPDRVQRQPTLFQRAAAAGLAPTVVGRSEHAGSGLTLALFRGARFVGADHPAQLVATVAAALGAGSSIVYAYHGRLDRCGHESGVDSDSWRRELRAVDRLVAELSAALPTGVVLVVVSDHGMLDAEVVVDLADEPALLDGVRLLAGEPRARYLATEPGAADDVAAAWRERLAGQALVLIRDEAVATGWFGPDVDATVARRIGDVVAVATGRAAVIHRGLEPVASRFVGQHGALTVAEREVPLVVVPPR